MKILVTGGTGHIGSHVVMELLDNNHDVTILARNPHRIPCFHERDNLSFIEGNLTDRACLSEAVKGKDACIHIALNYTKTDATGVLLDDTLPTVYLAECAAHDGVGHFIYTSSTAINDSLYAGCDDSADFTVSPVTTQVKQRPATYYGATKAACENFLTALSYRTAMRINIIRPGYTFGNPVVPGAPTEGDTRFRAIAEAIAAGQPVSLVKHDGTQFIWAGDLAKVYSAVLESSFNRKTYFALSSRFITWSSITEAVIQKAGSDCRIDIEDRGYTPGGLLWDVSGIERDFGFTFDPWEKLLEHVAYFMQHQQSATRS